MLISSAPKPLNNWQAREMSEKFIATSSLPILLFKEGK